MKTSHEADRSIIGLLTVVMAFVIFVIFYKNQDFLFETNMMNSFVLVSTIGLGLMLILFYKISNRKAPPKSRPKKSRR